MPTLANQTYHQEIVSFLLQLMKELLAGHETMVIKTPNDIFTINVRKAAEIATTNSCTVAYLLKKAKVTAPKEPVSPPEPSQVS